MVKKVISLMLCLIILCSTLTVTSNAIVVEGVIASTALEAVLATALTSMGIVLPKAHESEYLSSIYGSFDLATQKAIKNVKIKTAVGGALVATWTAAQWNLLTKWYKSHVNVKSQTVTVPATRVRIKSDSFPVWSGENLTPSVNVDLSKIADGIHTIAKWTLAGIVFSQILDKNTLSDGSIELNIKTVSSSFGDSEGVLYFDDYTQFDSTILKADFLPIIRVYRPSLVEEDDPYLLNTIYLYKEVEGKIEQAGVIYKPVIPWIRGTGIYRKWDKSYIFEPDPALQRPYTYIGTAENNDYLKINTTLKISELDYVRQSIEAGKLVGIPTKSGEILMPQTKKETYTSTASLPISIKKSLVPNNTDTYSPPAVLKPAVTVEYKLPLSSEFPYAENKPATIGTLTQNPPIDLPRVYDRPSVGDLPSDQDKDAVYIPDLPWADSMPTYRDGTTDLPTYNPSKDMVDDLPQLGEDYDYPIPDTDTDTDIDAPPIAGTDDADTDIDSDIDKPIVRPNPDDPNTGTVDAAADLDDDSLPDYSLSEELMHKFPFCIPFDLANAVRMMTTVGKAPKIHWVFRYDKINFSYEFDYDFSSFDQVASVTRWLLSALWIVTLIVITKKVIK